MNEKKGAGRNTRRHARREARQASKLERRGTAKPAPLLSQRARLILLAALALVLLVVGVFWVIADSRSYVAKVDGRRIRNDEYAYFLKLQQSVVESREGLTGKTQEERRAFWEKDAVEGENPILSVKNDALDNAREYAIQLQKAKEMGLSVDENIRAAAGSYVRSLKSEMGEASFAQSLVEMGITENRYQDILQNYYLIEAFKNGYIQENMDAPPPAEEEALTRYEAEPEKYDEIQARIIYFTKMDETFTALDEQVIEEKQELANSLLEQIREGADMSELAIVHSEATSVAEDEGMQTLNWELYPYEPEIIEWVFGARLGDVNLLDTSYGFFLVRVESRTGFEDARASLLNQLEQEQREQFYTGALDEWMKQPQYNVILRSSVFDEFTVN